MTEKQQCLRKQPFLYYKNLQHWTSRNVQLHKEGFGSINIARRKSDGFFEERPAVSVLRSSPYDKSTLDRYAS
jgi:hypothetical protein